MPEHDYIPAEDDEFTPWLTAYVAYVVANYAALGISTTERDALQACAVAWGYAFDGFTAARTAFHAATQDKDGKRAAVEDFVRMLTGMIQKRPGTTDQMRVDLGITVPKSGRTPAPIPSTAPTLTKIDTSTRSILRLFFADSATPQTKAKPAGVALCEIRQQIGGTAPTTPTAMQTLALEGRTPYRSDYEPEEVGAKVWLALRWVNTRGEPGPWSEIFAAVVPS